MNKSILEKKKNIYSQNGEDGIIEYIFEKINIKNGKFVEFGAWDGKHLSNSYNLFLNGWSGIFIEYDSNKYKDLLNNFSNEEKITCINSMVGFSENDNLDTIIENCQHKDKNFDFISIDVDGLDYNIFKAMKKYLPKVICIEVNAGHHPLYDKEIPISVSCNNINQSIKIISDHGNEKGYFPLCYTGNLFLVKNEYKYLFVNDIKDLTDIYIDFLKFHTREGIRHLYKTFVVRKVFNGFEFKNNILKDFCRNNIT
jgi:hypothetical protein